MRHEKQVRPLDDGLPRPRRLAAVVAVAGGALLVFGLFLLTGPGTDDAGDKQAADPTRPPPTATTTTTTGPPSSTAPATTSSSDPRLQDLVPGLAADLVAVVQQTEVRLAKWSPASAEPRHQVLPVDELWPRVWFDASGSRMAFLGSSAIADAFTLYVGSVSGWTPARVGVTSFVWHRTDPGRIGWFERDPDTGARSLCRAHVTARRQLVSAECVVVGMESRRMAGFDENGFVAQGGGEVVRIDLEGRITDRRAAQAATVGPGGLVLLTGQDGDRYLAEGAFATAPRMDWAPATIPGVPDPAAAWAPTRRQLAFIDQAPLSGFRISVWSTSGEHLGGEFLEQPGFAVTWDSSGRFVAAVGWDVLFVYDTFTDALHRVEMSGIATDAHLVQRSRCEDGEDIAAALTSRLPDGVGLDEAWSVMSRDAHLESWLVVSAVVSGGAFDGEVATWAIPGFGGTVDEVNTPDLAVPLDTTAAGFEFGDHRLDPEMYEVEDWMDIDGAVHSRACALAGGRV